MTEPSGGQTPPHDDAPTQPVGQPPSDHPMASLPMGSTEVLTLGEPGSAAYDIVPASTAGRRRGVAIGAGVLAVALLGGAAAFAASKLSGGGPQPDEAVPASAVAYFGVDFDPSSGQKIDALRFARKFPTAGEKIGKDDDLRKALFDSLKDDGGVKGDWATDVAPWLGQRAAIAVLPAAQDGDDPGVVVVLAVKDAAKAKAGLAKVSDGKAACEVDGDFAVCAQDAAVAKKAVADAKDSPLSGAKNYAHDQDALGDQGIVHGWVDLAAAKQAVPTSGGVQSALNGAELTGRVAVALRFDGPHLELAGRTFGTKLPTAAGKVSMAELPADSLAAISFTGADKSVRQAFEGARKAAGAEQLDAQIQSLQEQTGIAIPDDIAKALGDRVSLVFGGIDAGMPQIGARLSGDRGTLDKIVNAAGELGGLSLGKADAGSDTVLASTQAYADQVAKGKGLASAKAFKDAVPDASDAQAVVFVNIGELVARLGDQMDLSAENRKDLEPLASLGVSVTRDGGDATFNVRLATK
ncbi:DUF3352 domain-containing protein [Angustibacter sp. McL0619]|uniref:DUF3352 domain-containing protein n=1 Tax=Angustibacter sp. McL0619 TaxID=3415676 RepID=UPI003CED5968